MSKRDFIKDIDSDELQSVLKKYDFEIVNQVPFSEKELMVFYENYTDPLLTEARRLTNDNIFVLGNEMRAMLGHLADYRQNLQYRKNLKDAYGHFRRLNVDAFKIICDEADKSLLRYLKKHVHYDFRNVNSSFLFEYSQKYFKAKSLYLKAQVAERTGSDRASGNVIMMYYDATCAYAELLSYLKGAKSGIQTKVFWTIVTTIGSVAVSLGMIIINIITE